MSTRPVRHNGTSATNDRTTTAANIVFAVAYLGAWIWMGTGNDLPRIFTVFILSEILFGLASPVGVALVLALLDTVLGSKGAMRKVSIIVSPIAASILLYQLYRWGGEVILGAVLVSITIRIPGFLTVRPHNRATHYFTTVYDSFRVALCVIPPWLVCYLTGIGVSFESSGDKWVPLFGTVYFILLTATEPVLRSLVGFAKEDDRRTRETMRRLADDLGLTIEEHNGLIPGRFRMCGQKSGINMAVCVDSKFQLQAGTADPLNRYVVTYARNGNKWKIGGFAGFGNLALMKYHATEMQKLLQPLSSTAESVMVDWEMKGVNFVRKDTTDLESMKKDFHAVIEIYKFIKSFA